MGPGARRCGWSSPTTSAWSARPDADAGLIDGIEPVGAAADGEEALAMVAAERPDVVLMDLRMPRLDGIEATRRLAETHPGVGVVALTTYADDETVVQALQAGARAT